MAVGENGSRSGSSYKGSFTKNQCLGSKCQRKDDVAPCVECEQKTKRGNCALLRGKGECAYCAPYELAAVAALEASIVNKTISEMHRLKGCLLLYERCQ